MQTKIKFLLVLLAFSLLCLNLFARTSVQPVKVEMSCKDKQPSVATEVKQLGEDIFKKFFQTL